MNFSNNPSEFVREVEGLLEKSADGVVGNFTSLNDARKKLSDLEEILGEETANALDARLLQAIQLVNNRASALLPKSQAAEVKTRRVRIPLDLTNFSTPGQAASAFIRAFLKLDHLSEHPSTEALLLDCMNEIITTLCSMRSEQIDAIAARVVRADFGPILLQWKAVATELREGSDKEEWTYFAKEIHREFHNKRWIAELESIQLIQPKSDFSA